VADDTVTVPEGHQVRVIELPFEPRAMRTPAGAIVASLGSASDDPDRELDMVLDGVERELVAPAMVDVVAETGRIHMSRLFEPERPKTMSVRSPVTWCFHAGAAASLMASPDRRRKLVDRIQRIRAIATMQDASMVDPTTPAACALAEVLRGLDVDVKQPDTSQGGLAVFIEVSRPGGDTVCVVAGQPVPRGGAPSQDGAIEPIVTYRSPHLLQSMLDAQARGNATAVILTELLERRLPVFVMRMPDGLELRSFNGEGALPIYADATAVQWAAVDLGKPRDSYEPAPVVVEGAIMQAAKGKLGLAIGLYRDRKTPMYAVVPATVIAALASHLTSADGSR
jgi:hypothetical protein